MRKSNLVKLDLELFSEKLSNGLEVYIVPKDNINGIYVTFNTKFGSACNEFKPIDKKEMITVPFGIAHFLEHKMFEQKDGKDPFDFFSEHGCDANANTSNYKTTYLFSGSNKFAENLNFLLDYVQSPYFTDENVEKEKGIIEQEIKMYDDSPYYKIYDGILYNSFVNHPIKYPIAGTVEDINKITKEDLYNCYNTFYNPSNMFLVITGNVDPEEVINIVKANQDKKKIERNDKIEIQTYDEPNEVARSQQKVKMEIEIPKIGIGYKIDCSKLNLNINDIKIYLTMLFDLKLGPTSYISERLKKLNLITKDLDVSFVKTDKHILVIIIGDTEEPLKVQRLIEEELEDLKIENEDLERKKKVRKSNCIYRSDDIYSINNKIVSNIMNYGGVILDDYKKIDEIDSKELKKIISKISLSNKTIFVIDKA